MQQARRQHQSSGRLSGSRASHCLRRLTYYLLGYPAREPTGQQRWMMQVGQLIHNYIQACLVQAGLVRTDDGTGQPWIEYHVEDPSHKFHGFIDAVLVTGEVLEIKTCATERLVQLTGPQDWHLGQANLYAHWLGTDRIRFCYVGVDARTGYGPALSVEELPIREFELAADPWVAQQVLQRFWWAVRLADRKQLAKREFSPAGLVSQCHLCEYRAHCYPEPQGADPGPGQRVGCPAEPVLAG